MLQTQPWRYLLLIFITYWRGYKGRQGAGSVVVFMSLFHLERGDRTSQKEGSREGLDGRKVHVETSTDIWHSNSPCEVQFEGLRFGCACLCPWLRLGWDITSVIRIPEEQVLPERMQKGRNQNLAQFLHFPSCQTSSTPRGSLVQGPLLCASGLPFSVPGALFSQQLHSSAAKCIPSTKKVTQKPPSSAASLPFHLTAHQGLLQGSK